MIVNGPLDFKELGRYKGNIYLEKKEDTSIDFTKTGSLVYDTVLVLEKKNGTRAVLELDRTNVRVFGPVPEPERFSNSVALSDLYTRKGISIFRTGAYSLIPEFKMKTWLHKPTFRELRAQGVLSLFVESYSPSALCRVKKTTSMATTYYVPSYSTLLL